MSTEWRVRPTTKAEDAQAVGLAATVAVATGAVTFWWVRTLLGRDPIELDPPALPGPEEPRQLPGASDS